MNAPRAHRQARARSICGSLLLAMVVLGAAACGGNQTPSVQPSPGASPTVAGTEATSGPSPTGTVPAPTATEQPPKRVTLYPAQLERGEDTRLLHLAEEVVVDGDVRIPLRGVDHVWLLGRIGRDYLVNVANDAFDRYEVLLVRRDGQTRVVQRYGDRTTVTISADGRHIALATLDKPNTRMRVVETRSGALVGERTFPSYGAEVSDYGVRRVVVTGVNNKTYWWDPVTDRLSLIVARPAGAYIAADRLVIRVPDPDVPYEECQRTVRLSDLREVLWRSCRDLPLAFSPDASRMVTLDILSDGIGPREVRIRDASGQVQRTYVAPMWFGFIEWESDSDLLLQPVAKKYLAAVRCDVDGGCERASRLYDAPGSYDPPETMRWSFPE